MLVLNIYNSISNKIIAIIPTETYITIAIIVSMYINLKNLPISTKDLVIFNQERFCISSLSKSLYIS